MRQRTDKRDAEMSAALQQNVYFEEARFVGREEEIACLDRQLDLSRSSGQALVFVEAQSGKGKSRLIREFTRRHADEVLLLQGQGVDYAAQRPFQLFVGLTRGLLAETEKDPEFHERLRARLDDHRDALLSVLPELKSLWQQEQRTHIGPEDFGEDRTLAALSTLLQALGTAQRPALVVLDDCQWADELALKLITQWQKRSAKVKAAGGVMLIISFRSEEVGPDHALRTIKPDALLHLGELGEGSLRALLESMAGPMPDEVVEVVSRLAGGSPLMASVVLRGLTELGVLRRLPDGWNLNGGAVSTELSRSDQANIFLRRRIELLPAQVVSFLKIAAIVGREFEALIVKEIAASNDSFVMQSLEEAQRRHIVKALSPVGQFAFVHDKLRETLLDMLGVVERRLLNLRVAEAFETLHPERVFDLAFYFDAAGRPEKALPYALRAAEEARARSSLQIAEHQYRIALRGIADVGAAMKYRALRGLGDVLMLRGTYAEAETVFREAQTAAKDRFESAHIDARIGELMFKQGRNDRALSALAQAVGRLGVRVPRSKITLFPRLAWAVTVQAAHTLLPRFFLNLKGRRQLEEDLLVCRFLNRLAYVFWFQIGGRYYCFWAHFSGMNLAELHPPTPELCHVYSSHGPGLTLVPYFNRGIAYTERAQALARELRDLWAEGQAFSFHGVTCLAAGRFSVCIDSCGEAVRLLEQAGDLWERNIAACNLAYGLYRAGNLRDAVTVGRRSWQLSMECGDIASAAASLSAWTKAAMGDVPHDAIKETKQAVDDHDAQSICEVGQAHALYVLSRGDLAEAIALLAENYELVRRNGSTQEYFLPVIPWYATALRKQIELNLSGRSAAGQTAVGSPTIEKLFKTARPIVRHAVRIARWYRSNLPHALREAALVAAAEGRLERAIDIIDESVAAAQHIAARFEYAQSVHARGRLRKRRSDPRADDDLSHAREILAEQENEKALERLEDEL